ncbi:Uncharacterized protein Adt_46288 [Abeliophyllum distichum]|uniref:Uncharacterized protein n=1 Tax=Abeliophyllum distichum TaxID=126358 RepID=A0ABD1P1D6_9LAMI
MDLVPDLRVAARGSSVESARTCTDHLVVGAPDLLKHGYPAHNLCAPDLHNRKSPASRSGVLAESAVDPRSACSLAVQILDLCTHQKYRNWICMFTGSADPRSVLASNTDPRSAQARWCPYHMSSRCLFIGLIIRSLNFNS